MKPAYLRILAVVALLALAAVAPAAAQARAGIDVTCTNGSHITNGIEVMVNMRPGYSYTATAIGINGFDPVLAVLDARGNGLCDDDMPAASRYAANLPTSGYVPPSNLSSQVTFSPDTSGFADISLVVGGYNATGGEFVLILEGMAVTSHDGAGPGAGDPFYVRVTPSMIASGVPINAYMISLDANLDPYMSVVDASNILVMTCDDAGTINCAGQSWRLNNYSVSQRNGTQLPGYEYDAMISYSLAGLRLNSSPDQNYLGFLMTSYEQRTFGQYLVAFHMGTTSY